MSVLAKSLQDSARLVVSGVLAPPISSRVLVCQGEHSGAPDSWESPSCDRCSKGWACGLKPLAEVLCCALWSPTCGAGGWRQEGWFGHRGLAGAVNQQWVGGSVLREKVGLWKWKGEREGGEEEIWRCCGEGTEIEKLKGPQTLQNFRRPEVAFSRSVSASSPLWASGPTFCKKTKQLC